ncbi:hypothetical protein BGZ46_002513 [Entomortierella lignicola]|nr:hypothetical protein BGZ46_002513 [Entomortierella lignicola]
MSCAFHSYQLIVWGGSSGASRTTMLNNLPIVYNLNQDKWTDNYNSAEVERKSNVAGIAGGIFAAVIIIGGGVGFYLWKRKQKREQDAYHKDAVAAAAISSEDRDANIKVLAEDNSYEHIPYGDYLNYGGYGNNYPLNNVGAVEGYHGASDGSDQYYHAGSPLSGGSEKYPSAYSPSVSTNYYGGMAGTPYIQSPPAALIHHQSEQNPFVSPEDYHHPPGSGITSAAVSNGQHPSPTWVSRSPMPGARSPQAIPDSSVITSSSASTTTNSNGYIPPPPM